jgi:hypothetical protein
MDEVPRAQAEGSGVTLPPAGRWRILDDDDLLEGIRSLPPDHAHDRELMEIVRSDRHLFLRQEAAQRLRDERRLREIRADRRVGPILSRDLRRRSDREFLQRLAAGSRHPGVREAAVARLLTLGPGAPSAP